MASEVLRIRIRADSGNTAAVFNDISRNILGMTVGAAGARSGMMGLGAALSGAQITGRLAAAMFGAAAYGVYSMGSAMIQAAGAQDQFRVSMTALLKDTAKVDQVTSAVKRFADATSFSNEAVFQVAQNLVAAKVPLNNLIPTLQMLGDVSLGNAEKFSGIATAWYQIIAKGKLTAEEINQIAERGVSVWSILAEETGKSVPELQKLAETGKLTVDAYMPLLQRGLAKNYAGSLTEASNLSTNLLVNITKSITNFAAAIGAGLGDTVNPFLQFLAQAFQRAALYAKALTQSAIWARFTQSLQAAAEALAPIIKGIGFVGFIGLIRVVQILTPLMYFFAAALRGIAFAATQAMQFLKPLRDAFVRVAQGIKSLDWQGLWTSIKSQSSDIGSKIKAILLETLKMAWNGFRIEIVPQISKLSEDMIAEAWAFLQNNPMLYEALKGFILFNMTGIGPKLMPLIKAGLNWGTILGGAIGVADIQTGWQNNDWTKIVEGLVVILVAQMANAKFGPVGAIIGALMAQAVLDNALAEYTKVLNGGDWGPFAQIIVSLLAAAFLAKRGNMAGAIAAMFVGPEFLKSMDAEMAKGDFTKVAEIVLLSLSMAFGNAAWNLLLAGLKAGWASVLLGFTGFAAGTGWINALALLVYDGFVYFGTTIGPMIVSVVGAVLASAWTAVIVGFLAVVLIGARLLEGLAKGDFVSILLGALGVVAIAIGAFFFAIPGFILGSLAAIIITLFGYDTVKTIVTSIGSFFSNMFEFIRQGNIFEKGVVYLFAGFLGYVAASIGAILLGIPGTITAVLAIVAVGIVTGLLLALGVEWPTISQWFSDAFDSVIQFIKDILGITSPSTVFAEIGEFIIDGLYLGLLNTLASGWNALMTAFTTWGSEVIAWFRSWATGADGFQSNLLEFFSQPDAITKGIEAMWNGAKSLVSSTLDSIIEYFRSWTTSDFAKKLQDFFGADVISNAIKNGLKAAWEGAKSVIGGFVTDAKNAVSNAFSGMTGGGGGTSNRGDFTSRVNALKNPPNNMSQADAEARARSEGFAMGGSFRVGGSGGTDSQLVQFRASPNETVTIRRPDQGGGGLVIQTMNVYADSYQGGQDAARAIRDALGGQRKMLFATT